MTVTIEWMDTQEALPGEEPATRWRVPDGVEAIESGRGLILQRGSLERVHPWHRVRHIDTTRDAPLPMKLPNSMRIVAASVDGQPVPVPEDATIRAGDTLTVSKEGATILPPPDEADVLAKLGERQGRRRKR